MKKHIKYLIGIGALVTIASTGCKKDFFNRPPESSLTAGNFYQTVAEVQASTNILYGNPWFGLNGKAFLAIGDLQSGNLRCDAGTDGEFDALRNFSEGNSTTDVQSAWNSLYTVVAQCNALLTNLPVSAPSSIPGPVVNNALGEARLMRACAYFYLVRNFGNVPIVTDPTSEVTTFQTVPANPVTDVFNFIERDLQYAEANCTPGVAHTGHGSSASASALLAKVYLYEQKYALAKTEAEKVINSGEFQLVPSANYVNLFEAKYNNNVESILAEQWLGVGSNGYNKGNQLQSVIADSENGNFLTGTGDGYGEMGPSWDLQDLYTANGDMVRSYGTIQYANSFYPELHAADGGYTTPYAVDEAGTHCACKKYVTGTPADQGGVASAQDAANNTYLMRYSDVLLIEAEAIMGIGSSVQPGTGISLTYSSSDPTALKYINMVRQRAGIAPFPSSFTYQQLLNERRMEFAIEGDYWFDLQRLDGFNPPTWTASGLTAPHPVAEALIAAQNRGGSTGAGTAPTYATGWSRNVVNVTANDGTFYLPVPASESAADPALIKAPVHNPNY